MAAICSCLGDGYIELWCLQHQNDNHNLCSGFVVSRSLYIFHKEFQFRNVTGDRTNVLDVIERLHKIRPDCKVANWSFYTQGLDDLK